MPKTTMQNAMLRFQGESDAFILCGSCEPDGELGLHYQGNREQLELMFRFIQDMLKKREEIQ